VEGEKGTPPKDRLTQIYECMRNTPEHILRKALSEYEDKEMLNGRLGFDAVSPSIQHSEWITTPKFLAKPPSEILRNKEQNPVNLIMGANRHDGSFFLENIYNDYLVPNGYHKNPEFLKNKLIARFIPMLRGTDKSGAFPDIIAQTYFGDGIKNGIFEEMLPGLIDVASIWGMKAPAFELVQKQAQVNSNSYYYAFDFLGFWSTCDMMGEATVPCGVPHIDDISFTFQIFPHIRKELAISQRMVQYFVNFAYYGTPNNASDPNGLLFWEPYDDMTHPFLKIDMEDSIGYNCRDSWIDNSLDII
jgi:carboxylesterase type B